MSSSDIDVFRASHLDAEIDRLNQRLDKVTIERDRLRAGLLAFLDGNYPSPRRHRPGHCKHGVFFYEPCEECDREYLRSVLDPPRL